MVFHFYSREKQDKITEVGKKMLYSLLREDIIQKERIATALEDNPRDEAVLTRYFDMLIYG